MNTIFAVHVIPQTYAVVLDLKRESREGETGMSYDIQCHSGDYEN
jgi:hypothetical protein